jgi:MFS family permease
VTVIVYCSLFLNFFLVASFDNLGPRLADAHNISYQDLSFIVSLKSFVNMICGPIFALMSSKFPASLLFSIGGFSVAGSMTGLAFASTDAGFLIARALHGIGTSGLMVGGMSVLMRCVRKKERGRYSSIAYSSAGHAPLVAPILSGLMYDHLGQLWTFLIMAFVTFAVSAVSYVALARVTRVPRLEQSESQLTTIEKKMIWPCVRSMFGSPITYVALTGIISDGFSFGSCETTLPAALTEWDDRKLSVLTTSLIYSAGPLMFTIVAPIAGFAVDRTAHYKVLLFGLSMYVIFFPLFHLFTETLVGLGACIAIAFGIAATCEVAIYPFVAELAELTGIAHADTVAYALNELFIQAGYATGNVAGRALFDWNGFLAMGCFIGGWDLVAVLFCTVVLLVMRRKRAKVSKSPRPTDQEDENNTVEIDGVVSTLS